MDNNDLKDAITNSLIERLNLDDDDKISTSSINDIIELANIIYGIIQLLIKLVEIIYRSKTSKGDGGDLDDG